MTSRPVEGPDVTALRNAWAEADDRDAARGGAPAGADPERVWRAVAGELAPGELSELAEAAARDPELARSWRLARELHAASATSGGRLLQMPSRAAPQRWLAAAALVVLGLGAGLWLRSAPPATGGSEWRGGSVREIGALTPEGATLPRRDFVLRWTPLPEPETRYSLRVTTAGLELVAEARELAAAEFRVEPAALAGLPPGSRFYWQIDARLPGGRIVSSPAFAVVLGE